MHLTRPGLAILGLAGTTAALPGPASKRQDRGRDFSVPTYTPNAERANAVKSAFQHAWKGYYEFAFPHDSLRPITNSWDDDRLVAGVVAS